MAKEHAVWWILGGVLVLGMARSAQVRQLNATAAGAAPAQAGGFFGGLLSSLGIGGAAASVLPSTGLQPINYNPASYGSPAAALSGPSPWAPSNTPYSVPVTAQNTAGGGFNNLLSTFGSGGSPANPTWVI